MAEPPPLICPVVVPLFVTRSVTSDKPCFSAQWFQVWDSASCSLVAFAADFEEPKNLVADAVKMSFASS